MSNEPFNVYVGTLSCGCSVRVVVDEPKYAKDTAKSVAQMIKDGMTVERRTILSGAELDISRCIHKEKK